MNLRYENSSQRGIFLPLTAVVALGLFAFLFLLVGYTGRVKLAQSELRAKIDIACGNTIQEVGYRNRLNTFGARMKELLSEGSLRYSTITKAVIIMPSMPDTEVNFSFSTDGPPVGGSGSLDVPGCPPSICSAYRTVAAGENYPNNFWNNRKNAGNTVACEVEAKVNVDFISPFFKSLLRGEDEEEDSESTLKLKTVWWTPIRAPSQRGSGENTLENSPGLTIAIGTELFTTTWDKRFRFKGSTLDAYDPIKLKNSADADFFQIKQPAVTYHSLGSPLPRIPENDADLSDNTLWGQLILNRKPATGKFNENFSFASADLNFSASELPSDRDGLMTACMNPLILVRNTFLSTIVELAARHGQLRNMTEILHMNPMHRFQGFYPSVNEYIPNYPTRIVKFGQDLMQPAYQLPYVFYNTGVDNFEMPDINDTTATDPYTGSPLFYAWFRSLHGSGGSTNLGGWLNPFTANGPTTWGANPNIGLARAHALVSGQLRYCYNLYAEKGVPRFPLSTDVVGLDDQFDPEVYNRERDETDLSQWREVRKERDVYTGHWDQECQFAPCPTNNEREHLNAAQLMSILGSTQICPYNYIREFPHPTNGFDSNPNPTINNKTGLDVKACPLTYPLRYSGIDTYDGGESVELVPDILGTLNYINRVENAKIGGPSLAITPPGIFPLKKNVELDNEKPFLEEDKAYDFTRNVNSSILFVIHKPITLVPIYEKIQKVIDEMTITSAPSRPIRPITVINMPSNFIDSEKFKDLKNNAFIAKRGSNEVYYSSDAKGYTQPIVLYNFSPYDSKWGPLCGGPGDDPGVTGDGNWTVTKPGVGLVTIPQAEIFQDYWNCLLTDESSNIVNEASKVFNERLLRQELKY